MHNTQTLLGNNNSLFSPNIFWVIFCCCCLKYRANIGHSILKHATDIVALKIKQTFKSATFIPYIHTWKDPHDTLCNDCQYTFESPSSSEKSYTVTFHLALGFFFLLVVPVNVLFGCFSS